MIIAWRIRDGKPGHEKQSLGLLLAMQRHVNLRVVDLDAPTRLSALAGLVLRTSVFGTQLPKPDLIVGAGSATHLGILAAGRITGARTVVLMRPSLPLSLFDLAIIPAHDEPPASSRVLVTEGALTSVPPPNSKDPSRGIVLLGGPSSHYRWDDARVAKQVRNHICLHPRVRWIVTGSRRTPARTLSMLDGCAESIHEAGSTAPGWVETELLRSGSACVTPDSVSMVYEALTAGCLVSVVGLEPSRNSRVVRGLARLLSDGRVVASGSCMDAQKPFVIDESGRCAREIIDRWFADR